jgi:hypothetical protein
MDWLKKNYDLALLCLAALAVAASAALIALPPPGEAGPQAAPALPARAAVETARAPAEEIKKAAALLATIPKIGAIPPTDPSKQGSVFVSRPYILKDGKLFDPIDGGENLHPPLSNAWIMANGLDYSDPGIKAADPDGDGFSNLEEFRAGTNPSDPKSQPAATTKLRLAEFTPIPFRIEFKGDPSGEGKEFQINLRDLKGQARTQYKKLGDILDVGSDRPPYKIAAYQAKEGPNERGTVVNTSELTIENTGTGEKIVLVYNRETNDPASVGAFRNELTGEQFTVRKGQEFEFPPGSGAKFKVVDISAAGAQIQDSNTGAALPVPKLQNAPPAPQ